MKIDIEYFDYVGNYYNLTKTTNQRVHTDATDFARECAITSENGFFLDKDTFIPPSAILRITRIK